MAFFRQTLTIMVKDLRAEMRSKDAINASFAFALMILVLFSFAFDPDQESSREMAGGLLWIVFAFAGTLVLNRSFVRELPNDCLDALIAAPVSRAALFLGKALANFVIVLAVELVSMPIFGIFYHVQSWTRQFWPLVAVLALGAWGLTVIGTIFSALTVNIRLREVMLPLLIYPLMVPGLMAAMQLTAVLVAGNPINSETIVWLRLLIAFDTVFTALSMVLIETVLVG
jgi:heme exporter protein B